MPQYAFTARINENTPTGWRNRQSNRTIRALWGEEDAEAYQELSTWLKQHTSKDIQIIVRSQIAKNRSGTMPHYWDDVIVWNTRTDEWKPVTRRWNPFDEAPKHPTEAFLYTVREVAKILDRKDEPEAPRRRKIVDVQL
jgi:hypothetical protein